MSMIFQIVNLLWNKSDARIKLLESMQNVAASPGCKILYGDTDSVTISFLSKIVPTVIFFQFIMKANLFKYLNVKKT
jgi:hypothetical protein